MALFINYHQQGPEQSPRLPWWPPGTSLWTSRSHLGPPRVGSGPPSGVLRADACPSGEGPRPPGPHWLVALGTPRVGQSLARRRSGHLGPKDAQVEKGFSGTEEEGGEGCPQWVPDPKPSAGQSFRDPGEPSPTRASRSSSAARPGSRVQPRPAPRPPRDPRGQPGDQPRGPACCSGPALLGFGAMSSLQPDPAHHLTLCQDS